MQKATTVPLIVGIGASAGFDALNEFLANSPPDRGMAFVLVQHLAPEHDGTLVELLQRETAMPVTEAEDGTEVLPNHVFVIPPNATATLQCGRLEIEHRHQRARSAGPIDTFFGSLAEDQGERAVGIVLSGTGSDGSLGVRAINEHGGLTLAQAECDGHAQQGVPHSAAAGRADYMIKIEEMPSRLAEYQQHLAAAADAERKRSSADRGRLASIVESSQDAIILHSLDGIILAWNPAATEIFGYSAVEALGKPMTMLLPADVRDALPKQLDAMRRGKPDPKRVTVLRVSRNGKMIDLSLLVSPVRDADGRLVAASTVMRDITVLREKEAHQEMLLHELSHRVKNTLATVQSIAAQTLHGAPTLDAFQTTFQSRLAALAHAHDLLMRGNWRGAALHELVRRSLAAYGNGEQPRWSLAGEDIQINPKATLAFGMVFHELATNAVKYGALSKPAGRIAVAWQVKRDDVLHLTWIERGGPPVKQPKRRSFGSRLIEEGLEYELDAEVNLDYQPAGLRYTVDVALAEVIPGGG